MAERVQFDGLVDEEDTREQEPEQVSNREKIFQDKEAIMFGPRFRNADFDNYELYAGAEQEQVLRACRGYADHLDNMRTSAVNSLFLCGNSGTGKNHLAYSVGRRVVRKGWEIETVTFMSIMRQIKTSWDRRDVMNEQEVISKYQTIPFLILEELGVSYGTKNEKVILFELIDGRYKRNLPTIYTTNMNQEEFRAFADFDEKERIWDRLLETCAILHFSWDSYRQRRKQGAA